MLLRVLLHLTLVLTLAWGQQQLRYDYNQILNISLLFFEAQRAGVLPADNRISWRSDSCTEDQGFEGEDLTGGYFTQGTAATFTFPNAAALTVLSWGLLDFQDAYVDTGLRSRALEAIKWGSDHLVKCHTSRDQLYVLLGDAYHWGRPEQLDTPRVSAFISSSKPGSEVAAESAAALAASSMTLTSQRELYLNHAKQLYELAIENRGDYQFAVPQVSVFYKSWSGDEDELVWAAIWLYRATLQTKYLTDAETMYNRFNLSNRYPNTFSWDEKTLGIQTLLYQLTAKLIYKNSIKYICDKLGDERYSRTPKGLYYPGYDIGSLRYTSNCVFICLTFGEILVGLNQVNNNPYQNFAIKQLHYMLGDTGRSFVVGWGENSPQFAYHAGASCPDKGCNWETIDSRTPNPNLILGALVGGPDGDDKYEDKRDWRQNGVALDHNSGFQSAIAGLLSLHQQGRLSRLAYKDETGV